LITTHPIRRDPARCRLPEADAAHPYQAHMRGQPLCRRGLRVRTDEFSARYSRGVRGVTAVRLANAASTSPASIPGKSETPIQAPQAENLRSAGGAACAKALCLEEMTRCSAPIGAARRGGVSRCARRRPEPADRELGRGLRAWRERQPKVCARGALRGGRCVRNAVRHAPRHPKPGRRASKRQSAAT
jgi:hypothetical protein